MCRVGRDCRYDKIKTDERVGDARMTCEFRRGGKKLAKNRTRNGRKDGTARNGGNEYYIDIDMIWRLDF